jgi:hypothetical protein
LRWLRPADFILLGTTRARPNSRQQEASRMAEIVGASGVPHTPFYPALVESQSPGIE